ncbi:MAG: VanW family protein [Oscillospiraceae bacterium]|nr:VanW family protein [Oscillospiraceae bacterium]
MKQRKLFCEICPLTYRISEEKGICIRNIKNLVSKEKFAKNRPEKKLKYIIFSHDSMIRRKLGNVNMQLQDNKAVNLGIAAKKIDHILIRPGETFSLWGLVGRVSKRKGYLEGLTIEGNQPSSGIGGGMCQMSNLIHWMILHSDLDITEHHHHDRFDLFPDFNRKVPFGTGTSISYNYLDYRFKNNTDRLYQLIIYTTDEYLCGELRSNKPQQYEYRIVAENEYFSREGGEVYRNGEVYREKIDTANGTCIEKVLIRRNHAKTCYDTTGLEIREEA